MEYTIEAVGIEEMPTWDGMAVMIEYDDYGVYELSCAGWRIMVTDYSCILLSIYGYHFPSAILDVLALAEWCEEGLQWNA